MGVVIQLIREARENRGNLVVLWLDLTNAYRSILQKLLESALSCHHIPRKFTNLILDYYNNFNNTTVAQAGEGDHHWVHHFNDSVLPCDEHVGEMC